MKNTIRVSVLLLVLSIAVAVGWNVTFGPQLNFREMLETVSAEFGCRIKAPPRGK